MVKVALTGNRFSGKDTVAKAFEDMGVPVFHADPIIKFILNYRVDLEQFIIKDPKLGSKVFTQGFLDPDKISSDQFEKLLDIIEFDLFKAYDKFCDRNSQKSLYVIFHSSILFEKAWENNFDQIINVFTPREDRAFRARVETNMPIGEVHNLLDSEMDEFKKNGNSSYVIHSYRDVNRQVIDCNKMILDEYISLKEIERKSKVIRPRSNFKGFLM